MNDILAQVQSLCKNPPQESQNNTSKGSFSRNKSKESNSFKDKEEDTCCHQMGEMMGEIMKDKVLEDIELN